MKIVFLDAQTLGPDVSFDEIAKLGSLTIYQATNEDQVVERLQDATVAIANKTKFDEKVMASLPQLKLICVAATGMNNIDLVYAESHGIQVKNVAGYSTNSVVQISYALLFALLMRVDQYDDYVKDGLYGKSSMFTHYGKSFAEISGKQVGIIGMGAIGQQSAKVAQAFGAKVVYYSTSGKNKQADYQQVDLETLLRESDFVFIHAPLNDLTRNLIHAGNFPLMKPSALLINTGRGGIVNESDLASALAQKTIAGAGFDVFTREPLTDNHPLLDAAIAPQLVLTPHIAWCSIEARNCLVKGLENNIRVFQGTN